MEFVPIFGDESCLLSVKDKEYSEFDRIYRDWTDIEYLHNFFSNNEKDLSDPFWEGITIEEAIIKTRNEANIFFQYLRKISKKPAVDRIGLLLRLFHPLDNGLVTNHPFDKKKAYGNRHKSWLRIYALKAGENMYIITGGAIKLTSNMNEREHTRSELAKLEKCRNFLISEGIVDDDGVIEYMEL